MQRARRPTDEAAPLAEPGDERARRAVVVAIVLRALEEMPLSLQCQKLQRKRGQPLQHSTAQHTED